jgi:hypothetical protein
MIAICPVGPPKEMNPSLSQKRNASAKLGRLAVVDVTVGDSIARAVSPASFLFTLAIRVAK